MKKKENDTIPCDHCWVKANTLYINYLLNNDDFSKPNAESWEKDIFIDTLEAFNAITEKHSGVKESLEEYFNQYLSKTGEKVELVDHPRVKISYMAERSIPDEI